MTVDFRGILVVDLAARDPAAGSAGDGRLAAQHGGLAFPAPDARAVSSRVGAYGLDGAFSGWSDPIAVEMRGCTIADPAFPTSLALLSFLVRRHRRC